MLDVCAKDAEIAESLLCVLQSLPGQHWLSQTSAADCAVGPDVLQPPTQNVGPAPLILSSDANLLHHAAFAATEALLGFC